jgi:hypothetical protein
MFRQFLIGACVLAALGGCATGPHTDAATAASRDGVQQSSCPAGTVRDSPSSPGQCVGYGNSYSGKDLQQTGHENLAPALRTLDPSVTIQH